MSKHRRVQPPPPSRPLQPRSGLRSVSSLADAAFWSRLEAYNAADARQRAAMLPALGFDIQDEAVISVLTKSHFVIPGKTRWACQQCGECCRYARKVATFTYEPCPFLDEHNRCMKHDQRYHVCRWFPFWILGDERYGLLLTIKPYCTGSGAGPLVDYDGTVNRLVELSRTAHQEDDGAFVIHELLYLPSRKEWVFPSKKNVDEFLKIMSQAAIDSAARQRQGRGIERPGELHYAQHYTSGLLGSVQAPQATVNEQGLITDLNDAFCELCGKERAALVEQSFASLFVSPEAAERDLLTGFSRGRLTAAPQRLALSDDVSLPLLLHGMPFRDRTDGLVHGMLVCLEAVSPTVLNELVQSREYARGLIEASLDALLVVSLDGGIADVNEAVVTITGRSREALLGSRFENYFDNPSAAMAFLQQTLRDGQVRNLELNLLAPGGSSIPLSFNAAVFRDARGTVQGVFASGRDIRDQRKMIQALEEARSYARGLIESGQDLMVTISQEGIITDVNEAAVRMTGRSREAIIGSRFHLFFDEPDRAERGVSQAFRDGQVRNYELNLLQQAGAPIPVSFNATVYRGSSGEVQGVFAVARDITERLAMIRQLKEALERRG